MQHKKSLMKKLKYILSLTNDDNDYQIEQARSAEEAARTCGIELKIVTAENDGIVQSQQLLHEIQSSAQAHPDGIIFEPAGGTAMPQVARAAVSAGIAWVVLNRETEYLAELRRTSKLPIFSLTSDHEEIGRIQGQQLAALLPHGGTVLYISGPAESLAAKQRTAGMCETKPTNIDYKLMKAHWTEASAHKVVSSWLKLSTSQQARIDVVAAQDDAMAIGARKAFQDLPESEARGRWLGLPFLGCDGMPKTGQVWVQRGLLAATVHVPANAGQAIEMLTRALQAGLMPPEMTMTMPTSIPEIGSLRASQAEKRRILSAGAGL